MYVDTDKEPPCEGCYVELDKSNYRTWELYTFCRNQIRLTGMGDVIGMDYNSVIAVLKLYISDEIELKQVLEDIALIQSIEQESKKEGKV